MRDLNLSFEVTENPHLYTIQPLQVALSRANPESAELLDTLNRGLALMLESGEWASIVSQGPAQSARTAISELMEPLP